MKSLFAVVAVLSIAVTGCTTSSKVQEMIDASHRDYLQKAESYDASINLLKQSSIASLEKGKANSDAIIGLERQMKDVLGRQKTVQENADASKVMSAANTVKVADLEVELDELRESIEKTVDRLSDIDQLQEEVMVRHYQLIADSASAAIDALQAAGASSTNDIPVPLDEPIEIVAPDTTAVPLAK
jgi:hypothetical protein